MERKRYEDISRMLEKANEHSQEEFRKAAEELVAELPEAVTEQARRMLSPATDPTLKRDVGRRQEALSEISSLLETSPLAAQAKLRELQRSMETDVVLASRGPQGFGYGAWAAEIKRLLSVVKVGQSRP